MDDNLTEILRHFSLHARTFHTGLLCQSASFDAGDKVGYIHVLHTGELNIIKSGTPPFSLNEPSLIFYMNPTSHRLTPLSAETNLVCASFDFGNGLKNPIFQAVPDGVIFKLSDVPALGTSLQLLFTEASSYQSGQQALLDRIFEVIIIQLIRELITRNHLKSGLLAGLAHPHLNKAINAMHTEPARPWTLDDLASTAGMSRALFANKFRNIVGITPGSYLNDWRIGIAQSLLRRGTSLQQVAEAIGYANASALSRAFKATVGTTPAKWKNENIKAK